jgi:hypothetical protein
LYSQRLVTLEVLKNRELFSAAVHSLSELALTCLRRTPKMVPLPTSP